MRRTRQRGLDAFPAWATIAAVATVVAACAPGPVAAPVPAPPLARDDVRDLHPRARAVGASEVSPLVRRVGAVLAGAGGTLVGAVAGLTAAVVLGGDPYSNGFALAAGYVIGTGLGAATGVHLANDRLGYWSAASLAGVGCAALSAVLAPYHESPVLPPIFGLAGAAAAEFLTEQEVP